MALQPIDYSSAGLQALQGGLQTGLGLREASMRQQLFDQQAAEQEKQQQFGVALKSAWESGDNKAMVDLIASNPEQAESIQKMIGVRDQQQRQAIGSVASQLTAALDSGNVQGAAGVIQSNAETLQAMGQDPATLLQQLQQDPTALRKGADSLMLLTMSPDQVVAYKQKLEDQAIQRDKIQAQLRGQDIQMRGQNMTASTAAQRLAFDQGKFAIQMQEAADKADKLKLEAPKLSVNMEKALDSAVGDAATSRSSAASMEELASRWETEKPTAGIFGSAQSTWSKMTGSDTGLRDLRIRTSQFLNSQALKYLPPGPATDRDVELAREGVPTNMDDPTLISNWLKAQARNEKRAAAYNDFRAEWISAQGSPGQAKSDSNISGLDVRKGESFSSAAKRYMQQAESQVSGGGQGAAQQQPSGGTQTFTSSGGITFKVKG
ncbi:MAG: phage DNA ejection protein [Aeromonadaceae bacterium]